MKTTSSPSKTTKKTALQRYKEVCHKHMVIGDDTYIDVILGVIFANLWLDSIPVWLYLIAAVGGGKTIILQSLGGEDRKIMVLSHLTRNTLISGQIREKGQGDPSLLPKLNDKVLVVKDFTAMMGDNRNRDDLHAILNQLRDAYDGTAEKAFGTGEIRKYTSRFGIIAAVTPAIDSHVGILSPLGERFLMYRCPKISREERKMRADKASRNLEETQTKQSLQKAAGEVLALKPEIPNLPESFREEIINIVEFVSRARYRVDHDPNQKSLIRYEPDPEVPTRLARQLCALALGITMVHEKKIVTEDEMKLVRKVAADSILSNQLRLLKGLKSFYPEPVKTSTLAKEIRRSQPIVDMWLKDLWSEEIDIVEKTEKKDAASGRDVSFWRLRDEDAAILDGLWGKNGGS